MIHALHLEIHCPHYVVVVVLVSACALEVPPLQPLPQPSVPAFFQAGSVANQREHLVLLLANAQMRLRPLPANELMPRVRVLGMTGVLLGGNQKNRDNNTARFSIVHRANVRLTSMLLCWPMVSRLSLCL